MFKFIYYYFLKKIYELLIVRSVVINNNSTKFCKKLVTLHQFPIKTNKGDFIFTFKKDRRMIAREKYYNLNINTYFVNLELPNNVTSNNKVFENTTIIINVINLFKMNEEVLIGVLANVYTKTMIDYIEANNIT